MLFKNCFDIAILGMVYCCYPLLFKVFFLRLMIKVVASEQITFWFGNFVAKQIG
jgi:hypothetical protein